MKKLRFNYWKLAALCLILAISLVQVTSAKRTNSPSPAAFDQPDLNGEARTIDSFNDDLSNYSKKGFELSKKSSLTNEEFNALQRTGDDLKRRVSQVRDAVQSIVRKLKSAGRWDNLDEEILAKLTDAEDRAFVQNNGGLRHIFEDAVIQLDNQTADEILVPLNNLRSKVASHSNEFRFDETQEVRWQIVAASYEPPVANPPAPLLRRSVGCVGATIRFATSLIVRGPGDKTKSVSNNMRCQCNGTQCPPGGATSTQ